LLDCRYFFVDCNLAFVESRQEETMEINGVPVPIVTVELNIAGSGPAVISAKKAARTFVESLTRTQVVQPPPQSRADGRGRRLDIVA
jgi:hypothetical protein